jgi:hypothetical protein
VTADGAPFPVLHAGERRGDLPYERFAITDFPPQLGPAATCWKLQCRRCGEMFLLVKPRKPLTAVRTVDLSPMRAHVCERQGGSP